MGTCLRIHFCSTDESSPQAKTTWSCSGVHFFSSEDILAQAKILSLKLKKHLIYSIFNCLVLL